MSEPIELTFSGTVGKKNLLRPSKNGGMHYDKETKAILDSLAMQIPGWARDLNLTHCDVTFQQFYTNSKSDRDNAVTSMLDVLSKYHVIKDDCIFNFNGTLTILPAIKADGDGMTVTLYPREEVDTGAPPAPRYVDPKRARRMKRMQPSAPAVDHVDDLPDIPDDLFPW